MTITKTSNRNIEYKCRVYVPKAIPAYSYKNIVEYYRPYSGENEISRDDNGSVVEFNIHGENKPMLEGAYMPDLFRRFARQLINKENVDDLFTIFEQSISHINYITERIESVKLWTENKSMEETICPRCGAILRICTREDGKCHVCGLRYFWGRVIIDKWKETWHVKWLDRIV